MVPIYIGNNESSVVLNRVRDRKSYRAGKLVTNVTAFIFVFFFFFFFFFRIFVLRCMRSRGAKKILLTRTFKDSDQSVLMCRLVCMVGFEWSAEPHQSLSLLNVNIINLYRSLGFTGKFSRRQIDIFSFFSQKTGFDISCKLSPLETICMKCQNLLKIRNIFQYVVC